MCVCRYKMADAGCKAIKSADTCDPFGSLANDLVSYIMGFVNESIGEWVTLKKVCKRFNECGRMRLAYSGIKLEFSKFSKIEFIHAVATNLRDLKSIDLFPGWCSSGILPVLPVFRSLECVDVCLYSPPAEACNFLANLSKLIFLVVVGGVVDNFWYVISTLPSLLSLSMLTCSFTAMSTISGLTSVTKLIFSKCGSVSDSSLLSVSWCFTVVEISLLLDFRVSRRLLV